MPCVIHVEGFNLSREANPLATPRWKRRLSPLPVSISVEKPILWRHEEHRRVDIRGIVSISVEKPILLRREGTREMWDLLGWFQSQSRSQSSGDNFLCAFPNPRIHVSISVEKPILWR